MCVYNLSGSQSYCAVCKACIHWESCFSSEKVIICDNFRCEACTFSECPFENTSYCNRFDSDNKKLYYVVDCDYCIYHTGTYEECEEFCSSIVNQEIFEVSEISPYIISAEEYKLD